MKVYTITLKWKQDTLEIDVEADDEEAALRKCSFALVRGRNKWADSRIVGITEKPPRD